MNMKFKEYLFFEKISVKSKRKLLKYFGIRKNTYAGDVATRLYDYFYKNATNLKREYRKYYKKEFADYKDYLICRFNMPEHVAKRLCGENRYYVNLKWKGEHPGDYFEEDDVLRKKFWDFMGGLEIED